MHPDFGSTKWSDEIVLEWIRDKANKVTINNLQFPTIYEHAHHEAQQISKESLKKIKEIIDYFKKATK